MYDDQESIKQFERQHARDRMQDEARHVGDPASDEHRLLGHHLAASREAQRAITVLSLAAVAGLLAVMIFAMH